MTAVRTPPRPRRVVAWASWLFGGTSTRAEKIYLALSAGLCVGLLLSYAGGRWLEGVQQQQSRALVADGGSGGSSVIARAPSAVGASQTDGSAAALPPWVQAFRGTKLWSAASAGAPTEAVTQWEFLKVTDAQPTRLEVQPAGESRKGWVDIDDVGISGPPPDWVISTRESPLFASADGSDRIETVPSGTALEVSGEGTSQRTFVYWPIDVTSRRTGYGWIADDAVVPTSAPSGVSLPSPQYRAVPHAKSGSYRVQVGDSSGSIAARFALSPDDLFRINGIDSSTKLMVGQVLSVPTPGDSISGAQLIGPHKIRDLSPGLISAERAVVIDDESGEILWAKEANAPVAPASLTKIVTALVTLDHASLSDHVVVHVDSRKLTDSTVMGIYPGEDLTIEDLLYGLMLPSGNDAALALAEYVAGSKEAFADLMNEKARSLGLSGSHFVNPHGLDADGHYSTAYDMAMFARAGLKDSTFRALASAKTYDTGDGKGYALINLNQLLWRYPGADGVKIGYTDAAGRAIVGSATRDGHRVIVAMMKSFDIYTDGAALLDWAFGSYSWGPDQ